MNYSDFSFWWVLILFCVPFFTVRALAKAFNFWSDIADKIGIIALSMTLFLNASPSSFLVFIVELVFNYFMVSWMLRQKGWMAQAIATTLIVIDILVLAYFKYFTFLVEDIIGLVVNLPQNWPEYSPIPIFKNIPPGVSFYTFQMVSFVVDSLNARKKKPIAFLDYVNFIAFFPQIVAGPIERRSDLLPQIEKFKFNFSLENLEAGLRWISLGLFCKFVLADNLNPYIKLEEANNPWIIWFYAFLFCLRIYFDFGGYSFVAVGLGRLLGVKLTLNFLAPYTSVSINEFWRRWHITLSTWFRDYVFIPLMGSKKELAPFFLFLTFTLSGFWHGAAWNFIAWGAYHGALLLVLRYLGRPFYKIAGKYLIKADFVSWFLTFFSVVLGCIFFMETNTGRLLIKLKTLLTPWAYSFDNLTSFLTSYSINETVTLIIVLALSLGALGLEFLAIWRKKFEYEFLLNTWLSPLLIGLTILLAANTPSQFIYFAF